MTEAEWLECTEVARMLEFLRDKARARKLRLFACACCRRIWHLLKDERSRKAVEVAERFAEGTATEQELNEAEDDANDVWGEFVYADENVTDAETDASDAACGAACYAEAAISSAGAASEYAAGALSYEGKLAAEQDAQARVLRDLFGNPFRPVTVNPAWLRWNEGILRRLAESIYHERAFDRLPVLADALEDAGCDDADILSHCRGPGPHVRGCWALDLLLGKE